MIIPPGRHRFSVVAAATGLALVLGTLAALHYHQLGLTLSHYDARAHLVVARRIIDNITPGWQQIGAVWLPLPHLLNALPVQIDAFYRTGASAVVISIASFALAAGSLAWIVLALTGSTAASAVGAAGFALNPNVLYLQSTPMTEPLLLGATTLSVAMLMAFHGDGRRPRPSTVGLVLALACLTRYEAWAVTGAALAIGLWAECRQTPVLASALRRTALVAVWPAAAIAGFMLFSRIVVGQWVVSGGFFAPNNPVQGRPLAAALAIWWGTHRLSSYALITVAAGGLLALAVHALRDRAAAHGLVALSFVASAALPWTAFLDGHPFRIRYMVPLLAAEAVGVGVVAGLSVRAHRHAWLAVALLVALQLNPLSPEAPMVLEAQWDRPLARAGVRSPTHSDAPMTARPSWRAWHRSGTTCRTSRGKDSRFASSSTRATATSG